MRLLGFVALIVVLLMVVGGIAIFLRSIPDLARYRRLRKM
jgi:hypothetical protein